MPGHKSQDWPHQQHKDNTERNAADWHGYRRRRGNL